MNPSNLLNTSWSVFKNATDLKKRMLFVLFAFIVYRIGAFIPLPGLNAQVVAEIGRKSAGGVLGMLDMFSGGSLSRMTVFALNIVPYISASIIIQLFSIISPKLDALRKDGNAGRRVLNKYTRYLTIVIATFQAYAICVGIMSYEDAVVIGKLFIFIAVPTLVGGTLFLMWLGEQITNRGIGNGSSMLIFAGIVSNLPRVIVNALEMGKSGAISTWVLTLIVVVIVLMVGFVACMERANRKVQVKYAKHAMAMSANQMRQSEATYLPIKVNTAGVIPPLFASSLLLLPTTIVSFASSSSSEILQTIATYLNHGHPVYLMLYVGLLTFFAFFYTGIVFNPTETADNLKKAGAFIPGVRPGANTAEYLDSILRKMTCIGALYLATICLVPEILANKLAIPFLFSGTNIIIIVSVTIEALSQAYTHLVAYQYRSILNKRKKQQ